MVKALCLILFFWVFVLRFLNLSSGMGEAARLGWYWISFWVGFWGFDCGGFCVTSLDVRRGLEESHVGAVRFAEAKRRFQNLNLFDASNITQYSMKPYIISLPYFVLEKLWGLIV
jgi:hypothetical protein